MYIFIEISWEFEISGDPQPNIMIRDGVGAVAEGTTLVFTWGRPKPIPPHPKISPKNNYSNINLSKIDFPLVRPNWFNE
jgi:hypothetical protein